MAVVGADLVEVVGEGSESSRALTQLTSYGKTGDGDKNKE